MVSIHAPVQAGDLIGDAIYSTAKVSIHAPVQAGDIPQSVVTIITSCFNPRPRTSGRPLCFAALDKFLLLFQSTPPYKRATFRYRRASDIQVFQSTPPYKRATKPHIFSAPGLNSFNPRPRTSGRQPLSLHTTPLHKSFNPRPRTSGRHTPSGCVTE